jgi:toxin CptA
MHALALVAVWAALSGPQGYLAGLGILASLATSLRRALLQTPRSALALDLHEDGRGSWKDRSGAWHAGILGTYRFVSTWLVVLELGSKGLRAKRVVLLADSAPADDLRRLRVWLRWRAPPSGPKRNNLTGD